MLALVCLIAGILCAVISRILLTTAAFRVSVYWGLGLFLPFGVLFFRLNYPDETATSRWFRLATLACIFLYLALGGLGPISYGHKIPTARSPMIDLTTHYALESPVPAKPVAQSPLASAPGPTLEMRRAVNAKELEQLRIWGEQLRLRRQDRLHSDVENDRAYAVDLALYHDAMTRATAEQSALAAAAEK